MHKIYCLIGWPVRLLEVFSYISFNLDNETVPSSVSFSSVTALIFVSSLPFPPLFF